MIDDIKKYSKNYNLDYKIVYGLCITESGLNQFAVRYEPGYRYIEDVLSHKPRGCSTFTERFLQKCSIGVMQVMGGVYRQYGFDGWLSSIFADIDTQLEYGCKHLRNKIQKYGLEKGILAYNSGTPIKRNGKYVNQGYFDRVIKHSMEFPKNYCELFKGVK